MKLAVQYDQASQGAHFVVVDQHNDILLRTFSNTDEDKALATLSSAAPDLLATVKALRQIINDARADEQFDASTCDAGGIIFGDVASEAIEAADAAIAKAAEGRADTAPSRDERCLAWVERYNAELNRQEISPNGDDFNEVCHGVAAILSTGAEPDIHIKPAGR